MLLICSCMFTCTCVLGSRGVIKFRFTYLRKKLKSIPDLLWQLIRKKYFLSFSNSWCDIHPGVMVLTSNLGSWESESGRLPWVQGQLGLHGKFKTTVLQSQKKKAQFSQGYLTSICHLNCPLNYRKLEWDIEIQMSTDLEIFSHSNSTSLTRSDLLCFSGKEEYTESQWTHGTLQAVLA